MQGPAAIHAAPCPPPVLPSHPAQLLFNLLALPATRLPPVTLQPPVSSSAAMQYTAVKPMFMPDISSMSAACQGLVTHVNMPCCQAMPRSGQEMDLDELSQEEQHHQGLHHKMPTSQVGCVYTTLQMK